MTAAVDGSVDPVVAAAPAGGGRTGGGRSRSAVLRKPVAFIVLAAAFASPAFAGIGGYWLYVASLTLIYVLGAAGLNIILGYAGQISLAQGAFMGVGGYAVAILSGLHGWPMIVSLLVGALCGFVLGLVIGAPAIRVATHYLAMVTLGIEVIYLLVVSNESEITHGALGIDGVPRPSLWGLHMTSNRSYHVFVAIVVAAGLALLYWVLTSPWGRAFKSIRENERRAATLGVNVDLYKLLAFALGCGTAAIGGGLLVSLIHYSDPDTFPLELSFQLLLMVVIGGRGRFVGPFLGAVLVTVLPEVLRGTANLYILIFAFATIVILMFMPRGLITIWDWTYYKITGRPAPQLTK